jgi:hypothetical protein
MRVRKSYGTEYVYTAHVYILYDYIRIIKAQLGVNK